MNSFPEKGSLEYYQAAAAFSERIRHRIPRWLTWFLWLVAAFSILSVAFFIYGDLAHLDFLYKKHSREDDLKFVFVLLVIWIPLLLIGWSWLEVILAEFYSRLMIQKIMKK